MASMARQYRRSETLGTLSKKQNNMIKERVPVINKAIGFSRLESTGTYRAGRGPSQQRNRHFSRRRRLGGDIPVMRGMSFEYTGVPQIPRPHYLVIDALRAARLAMVIAWAFSCKMRHIAT
jgi:hypothetical protein